MEETKTISASLEDYLEAIYNNIELKDSVKAITLSKMLSVSRASVTEALKKLAEKKLINYDRYGEIELTEEGREKAKIIVSKHNLLLMFFRDVLHLEEEEAKTNACKIEHVITENAYREFISFMQNFKKYK